MEGWSLPDYGDVYATDAYAQYAAERGLHEPVARVEHNPRLLEREGNLLRLGQPGPWQLIESSGVMEGLPESHESFFVAHMAAEKLRQLARAGQPFSLVASFWSPHHPYFPTEPYASMIDPAGIQEYPSFRDSLEGRPIRHFMHRDLHAPSASRWPEWATWRKILSRCYGQILQLDAAIGLVLDALESTELSENTLVVCCADHGDALASHGGLWDKSATFTEEVGRIPLAVRWPARFRGGRCDALVSNMDCTATILEAAGVETPNGMHSRSLIPLCEDPGSPWPDHLVCEHNGHGEIVMTRILLSGRHKYVAALYDGDELYDLKNDPYETRNLIDDPACGQELARMRSLLIDHMESRGDSVGRRLLYSVKLKNREAR
jgi:arylsulfatase A-like enzyme